MDHRRNKQYTNQEPLGEGLETISYQISQNFNQKFYPQNYITVPVAGRRQQDQIVGCLKRFHILSDYLQEK